MIKLFLFLAGIYVACEAICSLLWALNDKSLFAQSMRTLRVLVGITIVVIAVIID
jgi:hypothetical protein